MTISVEERPFEGRVSCADEEGFSPRVRHVLSRIFQIIDLKFRPGGTIENNPPVSLSGNTA